jgi:hypothetical protein
MTSMRNRQWAPRDEPRYGPKNEHCGHIGGCPFPELDCPRLGCWLRDDRPTARIHVGILKYHLTSPNARTR